MTETDYDVVVIGAGPIGMSVALLVAQRGYRVGLFERFPTAYPLPRAIAMSHDSHRVFQTMGLTEAMKPAINGEDDLVTEVVFLGEDGEVLLTEKFARRLVSGYPAMTGFDQPNLEAVLGRAAEDDPRITVHRGWVARELTQDDSSVRLTLVSNDEGAERESVVTAKFVVGADGANSTIRSLMGVPVHDMGFAADWVVVDILPKAKLMPSNLLAQKLFGRPTTLAPSGPGRRRFEFMLLDGEAPEDFADDEGVWRILAEVDVNPGNAELVRSAVYTFRGRWAQDWRAGRVLLAGDAAHQMPPLVAQGFNSGMRDAVALAWRLDLILGGHATDAILDSYTGERLAHVQQLIEQSVKIGELICVTEPEAAQARDSFLRSVRDDPSQTMSVMPPLRSGPGLFNPDDDNAGYLGVQGKIEIDGKIGLLDDLVGYGHFVFVSRFAEPSLTLSEEALAIWKTLDGVGLHLTTNGPVRDVDGFYGAWLDEIGAEMAIMRPDYQVFGTARTQQEAEALIHALAQQLTVVIQ